MKVWPESLKIDYIYIIIKTIKKRKTCKLQNTDQN